MLALGFLTNLPIYVNLTFERDVQVWYHFLYNIITWSYPSFRTGKMGRAFLPYFQMGDTYMFSSVSTHNEERHDFLQLKHKSGQMKSCHSTCMILEPGPIIHYEQVWCVAPSCLPFFEKWTHIFLPQLPPFSSIGVLLLIFKQIMFYLMWRNPL